MILRHVGITVKDLDKSLFFYRDLLGFEIVRQMEESGGFIDRISALQNVAVTTVKMIHPSSKNAGMLELLNYHTHNTDVNKININHGGITHFALTVTDINKVYNKLLSNGIEFNCQPQISDDGGAIVTFCRDFENNLIELVEVVK